MNLSDSDIELFDHFINGDLNQIEMQNFQERLSSDDSFKKSFDLYQQSIHVVKSEAFRREVEEVVANENRKPSLLIGQIIIWASVAALLLFIILSRSYFTKPASPDLFAAYFEPYPNVLTFRSEQEDIIKGMEAYSAGDYTKAIEWFDTSESLGDELLFYKAMSYLSIEDFRREEFLSLLDSMTTEHKFEQQVRWYAAMAYLRAPRDREKAKEQLSGIEDGEFNYAQAQEILSTLNAN